MSLGVVRNLEEAYRVTRQIVSAPFSSKSPYHKLLAVKTRSASWKNNLPPVQSPLDNLTSRILMVAGGLTSLGITVSSIKATIEWWQNVPTPQLTLGPVSEENWEKSLQSYLNMLDSQKETLGPHHPETAISLSNIGRCYYFQKNYTKALEYHNQALGIRKEALGAQHADIAQSLNDIGCCLASMYNVRLLFGLDYFQEASQIATVTLGPEHPHTKIYEANHRQASRKQWIVMNLYIS